MSGKRFLRVLVFGWLVIALIVGLAIFLIDKAKDEALAALVSAADNRSIGVVEMGDVLCRDTVRLRACIDRCVLGDE